MKPRHISRLTYLFLAFWCGESQIHAYNGPITGPIVTEVHYAGADYHQLKSDDGNTDFKAPQWKLAVAPAPNTEYPIAYTKGATPKVKMEFKIEFEIPQGQTLDVKVKATGTDNVNLPEKTITLQHGVKIYTYEETSADAALPNTIKYYSPSSAFTLTWKFVIEAQNFSDTTKNRMYLTVAKPTCATLAETLFYYACHNPSGNAGTNGKAVTNLIWNDFKTLTMKKVDHSTGSLAGADMTFWPSGQGKSVVEAGTGVCASWAEFFGDVLRVHAYTSEKVDVKSSGITLPDGIAHPNVFWLVNDQIVTSASAISNGSTVPGPSGVSRGQGAGCSYDAWAAHSIAKAHGEIYDPSYGIGPCADELSYENIALPGFRYTGTNIVGNPVDKYIKKDALKRLLYTYIP